MSKQEVLIDLMRHGEPVGGRAYRGNSVDDPLTGNGWQQMRNAVGQYTQWDRIITSPLRRCREFAEELGARINVPVTIEPGFREVGFGVWEGKSPGEIIEADPESYEAFYRDPEHCRPDGAEPLNEFSDRVIGVFDTLVQTCDGENALVVSHAGVMRAIVAHVLVAPLSSMYRLRINNGGMVRIRYNTHGTKIELLNGSLGRG
jgi:alpha-ribazole phosphatase